MELVLDVMVLLARILMFFAEIALVIGIVVCGCQFVTNFLRFVAVTWDWARFRRLRKPFWTALGDAVFWLCLMIMLILCLVGVDVLFSGIRP